MLLVDTQWRYLVERTLRDGTFPAGPVRVCLLDQDGTQLSYIRGATVVLANSSPMQHPRSGAAEVPERVFRHIADHETFRAAPVMRALLIYLWEHQGEPVTEYAIAVDALGRTPTFEPKSDATVRVQIARLRTKLNEFYDEDPSYPLRLTIPRGTHELQWRFEATSKSLLGEFWTIPLFFRVLFGCLALGMVLCLAVAFNLQVANRSLRVPVPASASELPTFWKSFLANGKAPMIVVPSPVYFLWPDKGILVRDFKVSEFPQWPRSPFIRELAEKWGQAPTLYQTYVSVLDMEAAVQLEQYLEGAGQKAEIIAARRLTADTTRGRNPIFMGVPRTASHLKEVFAKTPFYIDMSSPDVVHSRLSTIEYKKIDYSSDHKIYPEIIAWLPPMADGSRTLLLLGVYPAALAYMLGSREGLKTVDAAWAQAGRPDSWEMVVNAEMNGEAVLKASPITTVRLPADFWKN